MPVDPMEEARERLEAIRLLLPEVTQLLDAAKQEWSRTGEWSDWDQSVRDRLGAWMMGAELDRRSPPTREGAVAWRVKDFADGWILFHSEREAHREAEGAGNLVQPLYLAAAPPPPEEPDQ